MSDPGDTVHGPIRMWLVTVSHGRPERAVEVGGPRFMIGRGEECDLVLNDPKVSREHAAIVSGGPGRRLLYDLESANGTLVNGHAVRPQAGFSRRPERVAELWGGEKLQFGDTIVVTTTQDPDRIPSKADEPVRDQPETPTEPPSIPGGP